MKPRPPESMAHSVEQKDQLRMLHRSDNGQST